MHPSTTVPAPPKPEYAGSDVVSEEMVEEIARHQQQHPMHRHVNKVNKMRAVGKMSQAFRTDTIRVKGNRVHHHHHYSLDRADIHDGEDVSGKIDFRRAERGQGGVHHHHVHHL